MLFQNTTSSIAFVQWIIYNKENKLMRWIIAIIMVISFGWLKYMYPYPNFMPPDSYSYLKAAYNNEFINTWPIGYSRFLRLVSSFNNSHFFLVTIQYLLLVTSVLYFLFTIRYLLSPSKWLIRSLLVISIGNPLLPHIANFISSDCIFAAFSLIWFSQLFWILHQPTKNLLLIHSVVLLLAFMLRFTALYYPIISIAVIMWQQMPSKLKLWGTGSITFLLSSFIGCTQFEYKAKTDTIQYSAFGGWQLAANALYGYAYAQPDSPNTVPAQFRELHTLVNLHMDSIRQLTQRPDKEVAIYYLWDFKSPIRLYMKQRMEKEKDPKTNWFKIWASLAPLYQQYGRWLIMKHPIEFTKHYLWPNLLKYYAPPVKFMGSYNLKLTTVQPIAVTWFGWRNNELPTRASDRKIHITAIFPTLLSIINPLFLLGSFSFIIFRGLRQSNLLSYRVFLITWLVWFSNMCFSVLSAPIELRYQLFPITITIPFCVIFINWIIQTIIKPDSKIKKESPPKPDPAIDNTLTVNR